MRLSEFERKTIVTAVSERDPQAEVWLIGSRVSDQAKGGDIDLLVISSKIEFSDKIDLLVRIKMALGEQKIDLSIVRPDQRSSDPFALSVLPKALRL